MLLSNMFIYIRVTFLLFRNHTGKLKHTTIGHFLALNNFETYLFALSLSSSSTSPSKMLPSFLKETKRNKCWSENFSFEVQSQRKGKGKELTIHHHHLHYIKKARNCFTVMSHKDHHQ